jgi:Mg2+ and Co2+ transporter CorA
MRVELLAVNYLPSGERSKNTTRTAIRELAFFFVPLSVLWIFFGMYFRTPAQYRLFGEDVMVAVIAGVPIAFILWALYRLIRYAISR